MEIKTMTAEELEKRMSEIATEIDDEEADLDALEAEAKEIKEELEERKNVETKKAEIRSRVAMGEGTVVEEIKEENKDMSTVEARSTKAYKEAYGEYVKKNYDLDRVSAEQRAILTVNAESDGMIEVPIDVDQKIQTAWERDEIMSRISKTFFKGNQKVGYEVSADPAVIHKEGSGAVTPENLVIEYVDLIPEYIKKLVEVSHNAIAMNDALVDYLYDELEYQIVKLAAANTVKAIEASTLTQSFTLAGATPTTADVINAAALLSGEATNPVIITTRATAAALKSAVIGGGYAYDPFDGMEVLYTDAANLNGASFIIADLSGVRGNFPEGYGAKFIFDELTKADENIVRIVGRLLAAIAVIASGKTVKAVAGNSNEG